MKKVRNNVSTQGYVKIPRSILNKGWLRDVSVSRTYLALMLLANYESTTVCKRGTVGFSLTELAGMLGMDTRTIKDDCKVLGFEVKTSSRGTQIIIPNYDESQGYCKKPCKDTPEVTTTKEVKEETPIDDDEVIYTWDDDDDEGS